MSKILMATIYRDRVFRMMSHAPMWVWKFYIRFDPMAKSSYPCT